MIILLGETAEAREVKENLNKRGLELLHMPTWAEHECPQVPHLIIDVSHPSVSAKLAQLRHWCLHEKIPYLRLQRPETELPVSPLIFPAEDWEEVIVGLEQRVAVLAQERRRLITVFVTTGRYRLETIVRSKLAKSARLVVRILPEVQIIKKCKEMGIRSKNIVAMQGPFSKDINKVLFKFYGVDILLTRDSGSAGGTDTKISAALELGIEIVFLQRAQERGRLIVNTVSELMAWIDENVSATDLNSERWFYNLMDQRKSSY
ncbi:precorrin-6A/cobalt-precorrin-6A reductase [Desulfosporosinus sp. PR]|uniref:precorrin-6A/cobalt-precorrin-6A reductase n=1 Tax=Candidatus Desulfosporosinus nitrosoreducens TaxID=3401928 RepID=UPI0027F04F30|nr:precorrin-6A/cobalt-precorrin-6A reductase [Desulfosporosinus sp. PR]MDQ7094886.1 precorrin-6A/cobalt-precorrin-6A reductase [Desulfosporosinus sp. PR]